jgi:hypothetical protein
MPGLLRRQESVRNSPGAKAMRAAKLLQKLQGEADLAFATNWKAVNREIVRRNTRLPPTKAEQDRARLFKLRRDTAEILNELQLARQLEVENARYLEARSKQRKANMTVAEKKAQV